MSSAASGQPAPTPDELLEAVEVTTGPDPRFSVVWLHGLGADGHDFEPVIPMLGLPADAQVRFVFPHAPVRPVTLNGGMPMRAWYDIKAISASRDQDEAGIARSAAQVEALLAREEARGVPPEQQLRRRRQPASAISPHPQCGRRARRFSCGRAITTATPLPAPTTP
ncbi:MAG: hypothetical protein HRU51_07060, partial [Xanthomonadales bacterium]|nr:hypothetical protein [Xanthomonadales bacterium]